MTFNYYVWYRTEGDEADCEVAIRGMMARLACRTGTAGQLLKKHGEPALWMEAYEGVRDCAEFERKLHQVVNEFDVEIFIAGSRHTECFVVDQANTPNCTSHS